MGAHPTQGVETSFPIGVRSFREATNPKGENRRPKTNRLTKDPKGVAAWYRERSINKSLEKSWS